MASVPLRDVWPNERIATLLRDSGVWPNKISRQAVDALIAVSHFVHIPAGHQISTKHGRNTRLLVILSGMLRVSVHTRSGKEFLIDLMEPGNFSGLMACLDERTNTHDAVAEVPTDAFTIAAPNLLALMLKSPEVQQTVMALLCARLRLSFDAIEQFAVWTPRARLANRLLDLAKSYGRKHSQGIQIAAHLPQESLAAMIGLSRQHTNTILKDFEKAGIVVLDYGTIVVRDAERLRRERDDYVE